MTMQIWVGLFVCFLDSVFNYVVLFNSVLNNVVVI